MASRCDASADVRIRVNGVTRDEPRPGNIVRLKEIEDAMRADLAEFAACNQGRRFGATRTHPNRNGIEIEAQADADVFRHELLLPFVSTGAMINRSQG